MPGPNKVAIFTNEYPPNVYGGAGVHVEYLSRELARLLPVEVRCFGSQDVQADNLRVKGYPAWDAAKQNTDPRFSGALDAFYRSLAMAKDTLQQMAENTNKVAQKESIRIAMGVQEQNADLTKAIDDLGSYGEVVRAATNITREGLTEMRGKLAELKTLAESVQGDIHESIAVNADTRDTGVAPAAAAQQSAGAQPAAGPVPNPFKLGGN